MNGLIDVLSAAAVLATLAGLAAARQLWQDRNAEIRIGRDDGTKPWLLSRVVVLCAGCVLVGLWISVLSIVRLAGASLPWAPPVSYVIGIIVILLPSWIAWEFRRRAGR